MAVIMSRSKQRGGRLNVKQTAFPSAYAQAGVVAKATEITGIQRNNDRLLLKEDPDYAVAFQEAHQEACDKIGSEMRSRAIDGADKRVFYKGQVSESISTLCSPCWPEKYKRKTRIETEVCRRAVTLEGLLEGRGRHLLF
jgi:hypothetical protein